MRLILFMRTRYVSWYQTNSMAGDKSLGNGHAPDGDQGIEVLRASLLTQETALRALADNVDHRFQAFETRFDEIADRLDALALGANRGRNENRRQLRDDVAQGQHVNRPVPIHNHRQPVYSDDS